MPDNTLHLQDKMQRPNITETDFNSILDVIEDTYKPIFQSFGANFVLERAWSDSTVNAYADQVGRDWIVHMYGGMARRQEMNVAGFGLVACHEIGHHLGGFPKYSDSPWAANEGQSDYFSTFACARKVFDSLPVPTVTGKAKEACDKWPDQSARETCYKIMDGGLALGKLLAVLGGERVPTYETPDPSVVTKTSDSHPRAQCRLDTYYAGEVCADKVWNDKVIPTTKDAVCANRPRCWYADDSGGGDDGDGDGDPDPTNPDGDYETMDLYNGYRQANRINVLAANDPLICAASLHATDISASGVCGHTGTNGSSVKDRVKQCGYSGSAKEHVACRFKSAKAAVNAWIRESSNRRIMLDKSRKSIGCASANGYYVCVTGSN
jgi:uncharacterized protein YkwD